MTYIPGSSEPRREPLGQPAYTPPMMATQPAPPRWAGPPTYYAPPPRPKKKGMPAWGIILIVLGGFVVLLCGAGVIFVAASGGSSSAGPKPTVHVTSCSYDGVIATYMNYTLTNNDTRPHDYFIEGTVGHSPAIPDVLKNVGPHETVSGKLMGTEQGDCRITRVDQQ